MIMTDSVFKGMFNIIILYFVTLQAYVQRLKRGLFNRRFLQ